MIDKQEMAAFFDKMAAGWDASCPHIDARIRHILDYAAITEGVSVLDVACGTGVLIPDYLERRVSNDTAIDIAPGMIAEAGRKFAQPNVHLISGDVETWPFLERFDRIMVYNALPHFNDPRLVVKRLNGLLNTGGRLTIAHGASREEIDSRHSGHASRISNGLLPAEDLAQVMGEFLNVDTIISDDQIYVVSGVG